MTRKILALTDLSDAARPGLQLASSLAVRGGGSVVVGHVQTRSEDLAGFGVDAQSAHELVVWARKDEERRLRQSAHELVAPGRLEATRTVADRSARRGIAQLIADVEPDVVCLATHGRTALPHMVLGSVAEHVVRTSPVPVLVTRECGLPPPAEPMRVLLPLDLVDEPDPVARRVSRFVGERDEVTLAHALELGAFVPSVYGAELAYGAPDLAPVEEAARLRLAQTAAVLAPTRTAVRIVSGRPQQVLLDLAETLQPHLIVTKTHGKTALDRMILGSVSERLVRRAPCAVLVLPRTA